MRGLSLITAHRGFQCATFSNITEREKFTEYEVAVDDRLGLCVTSGSRLASQQTQGVVVVHSLCDYKHVVSKSYSYHRPDIKSFGLTPVQCDDIPNYQFQTNRNITKLP